MAMFSIKKSNDLRAREQQGEEKGTTNFAPQSAQNRKSAESIQVFITLGISNFEQDTNSIVYSNHVFFFIPPYRFFTAFDVLSELREFADKELQEPNKKLAGGHKGTVYILGQ